MSKYLSDKLTVLYTLLIVMVVYIHSTYLEARQYEVADFIQTFMGQGLFGIANCLFFLLSGFLFARSVDNLNDCLKKQKKRFRTLVLPYILWNLIFVLWYVMLAVVPGLDCWVNSTGIVSNIMNQPVWDTLYDWFVVPAAFQLWFLRDLIVMLVFVPLLWGWAYRYWQSALVAAVIATCFYSWLIYFWLGIIISVRKWNVEKFPDSKLLIISCGVIYIGYAVWQALYGAVNVNIVIMMINLCGLYFLWSVYDVLSKRQCISHKGIWKYICGYSFFIYCFHEPAFNIIKKLPVALVGDSQLILILFYLINPWIMVGVAIMVALLLQRYVPKVYSILTGGR